MQWQPLDTGKCFVKYNIKFIDRCGRIVGNITTVRNNISFYCTEDYANIYSLIIWATYNGVKGTESQIALLRTTPKTTITSANGM